MSKELTEIRKSLQKNLQEYFRVPVENYFQVPWLPVRWVLDKGLPLGRIIEVYGPEQSGKSTFAYQVLGQFISQGGIATVIDTEGSFVPSWIRQLGMNPSDFVITHPDHMEGVFDVIRKVLDSIPEGTPIGIVWDSVIGTPTRSQLEGKTEIATGARVLSSFLPRITKILYERQALVIFINQARVNLNFYGQAAIDTSGGYALRHDAAMRILFQKSGRISRSQGEILGHEILINVVKSKVGEPYRFIKIPFFKKRGFDRKVITVSYAITSGLLEVKGAWLKWKDKSHSRWDFDSWSNEEVQELESALEEKIYGTVEEPINLGDTDLSRGKAED